MTHAQGKKVSKYRGLSVIELREGCALCFKNSQDHLFAAEILINSKLYGMSSSHIVLGLEELCKAVLLRITSIDSSAIEGDLDAYFHKHPPKHDKLKDFFTYLVEQGFKSLSPLQQVIFVLVIGIVICYSPRISVENRLLNRSLNDSKNCGLYVDYEYSIKKWRVPTDLVQESEVRPFLELAKIFSDVVNRLMLNDGTDQKMVDELLQHVNRKGTF